MLIKPFLEIALTPRLIEPVSRVMNGCVSFLGNSIIVGTKLLEKAIALVWLRNGNVVVVSKGFERAIRPAVPRQYEYRL